ncbi:hypothetical protein HUN01_24350 [Nostoc edaphicum CCNP1411]|uniref:Uncharacterized protein n=1 Tax=Nostoc edaphicum CCNP1411 TaxID=1472755 RepID=A0A7D7LD50_9NOSO|nr:hypothetical protein [Nostoc edaphicum]QMS90556.1 hypothetical protein HUN01_24350 [Nostoc edaphicum CCNP1411]
MLIRTVLCYDLDEIPESEDTEQSSVIVTELSEEALVSGSHALHGLIRGCCLQSDIESETQ